MSKMNNLWHEKYASLERELYELAARDMAVAFSGGVDSSLLLKVASEAAKKRGTSVYAVTFDTWLHPRADVGVAEKVAAECGAVHVILKVDERAVPELMSNPANRCYLCKRHLFKCLWDWAKEKDIDCILEGTNLDDTKVWRPGRKALEELGIRSPLADHGITKEEVRAMSAELGLSVAERPSAPCMATRLPYGASLDADILKRLEQGENWMRNQGFHQVRLRYHEPVLRIEIMPEEFSMIISQAQQVVGAMKELGFLYVTLDMEGFRSGSMDIDIDKKEL